MPNFKEIRVKITGKVNGSAMTPLTIPLPRLLDYLRDLSVMFGSKDAVHLVAIADGSTSPVFLVDEAEEPRVLERARMAQLGKGPRNANFAYRRFNQRLRADQGSAEIEDVQLKATVLEFPGIKFGSATPYGPIFEHGSVVGRIRRVGGLDETVPIWLQRADGQILYCESSELVSQELAALYLKYVRVHGVGMWYRNDQGQWRLEKFRIQSFDQEAISEESIISTIDRLRAIPNNGWSEVADPLGELYKMRYGDDEPKQ